MLEREKLEREIHQLTQIIAADAFALASKSTPIADTGERFYGSARRMKRLVDTLRVSSGEFGHVGVWMPDSNT